MSLLLAALAVSAPAAPPTFSADVAPIVFAQCATCHRPGEIGPFPLTTYAEVKKRAKLIARVTADRTMPPWKPEPGHGDFLDARRLSGEQVATLRAWADAGAPEGDPSQTPELPAVKAGWKLGKPDIVLRMPKPVTVPAEGRDLYFHVPFRLPIESEIYVKAVECRPGNPRVAHHAVGILDSGGTARRKAAKDPRGGYEGFGGPGFLPAGFTPGYVPGQTPRFFPAGTAITIKKGTDLVLQMHYHPSGKAETDQTEVGLYLTKDKPTRHNMVAMLASEDIDIPPGKADYTIKDQFVLPVDLKAGSVWAHMHLIGKTVHVWAEKPDGTRAELLKIGDWDFNWQDTYLYREPVDLPRGTTIKAVWTFDNTAANPRNPFSPPRRVRHGENSTDEMGGLIVSGEVANELDSGILLLANVGHYFEVAGKKGKR